MRLRSTLLAAFGFAIIAASVGAFLLEASYMCQDVPFIDDWNFVHLLKAFINHQIGWRYFITRYNGHPFLLARTAMVLDWRFASLDMALLHWCTIIVMLLAAILLGARLAFDLVKSKTGWKPAGAIMLAAPAFALALSLGQWENLSVATAIDNAAVNLFLLLAVIMIDCWVRTNRGIFLITAMVSAIVCSMTVLQGMLVWPALIGIVLLGGVTRRRLLVSAAFLAVFLGLAAMSFTHVPRETFVFALLPLLLGNLILAGSTYVGQIHNHPVLSLDVAVGALSWTLTALAVLLYWRAPTDMRARMNKYAALVGFGMATSLMIEIGRLSMSMETMAASRYINAMMPWAWGLYGVLTLGMRSSYWACAIAGVQIAAVVIAVAIADFEELQIAPSRREDSLHQIEVLRDGKGLDDRSILGSVFYMDRPNGYMVAAGRAFLFENRLSLFRPGAADAAGSN